MRTLTDVFTPGAPTLPEGLRTLAVSPERELEPGMTVRAHFTFRNQGGAPATGVRVRFNVPDGLLYLVGSAAIDGTALPDDGPECALLARAGAAIGDVAPGEERRIELAYSVAGAIENGCALEIQAAVCAAEVEPVGSNVARLIARSRPALRNALTCAAIESQLAQPSPGSEIAVCVRVHNAGESSAHDVAVFAPLPEHTEYVRGSARVNGREIAFDPMDGAVIAGRLAASATAELHYRARIADPLPDGTPLCARARIGSQETAEFEVEASSLRVSAACDFGGDAASFSIEPSSAAAPGSRVALHLRARNAGTAACSAASLALLLPDGALLVRGSAAVDGHPLRDRKNGGAFDLGPVPAGSSIDFSAEVRLLSPLADGANLPVRALFRFDGEERAFERSIAVRSQPYVNPRRSSVERLNAFAAAPGSEVEAAITVCNDGSGAATDALLHLYCAPALEDVRLYEKNTRLELANGCAELGTIDAYCARRFTLRARVASPLAHTTGLEARVTLHAQELGEVPIGAASWIVASYPRFSAETSHLAPAANGVFRPNQTLEVFARLRNEGTETARGVRLRVMLAPELQLESVDGAGRERSMLAFGDIAPGETAEARLEIRVRAASAQPASLEASVSADGMLPVPLERIEFKTEAAPDFSDGMLQADADGAVRAGEELAFALSLRNGGDGAARRVRASVEPLETLIYVPNSTSVNGIPVRDCGARSALADGGIVMSDVNPGVQMTIRWREVVTTGAAPGQTIRRTATVAYDGDRADEFAAGELTVQSAPAFGNAIADLPFALDGMLAGAPLSPQRAIAGAEFVELPPATPAAAVPPPPEEPLALESAPPYDPARIARALRVLGDVRMQGLVWHLYAIRALLPDEDRGNAAEALSRVREDLRETLDRLFIKLRLPNYVIAARDLESDASRAALEAFLAESGDDELQRFCEPLACAGLGTAPPWAALSRVIPARGEALRHYRAMLGAAFDELADADAIAFADALQRRAYPVLDAALEIVRAQLANALA